MIVDSVARPEKRLQIDVKATATKLKRLWFTWYRMGDRGYREHSAGIFCCHGATEKRGARGTIGYRRERTAVSTLRTDIKTGCLHSAGAPFWSFDLAPGFYFRTRGLRERRETDEDRAGCHLSARRRKNLADDSLIRQKSTNIYVRRRKNPNQSIICSIKFSIIARMISGFYSMIDARYLAFL